MGRKTKRRAGPVYVERELIDSSAFMDLGGKSPQVLMLFLAKRRMERVPVGGDRKWSCTNNGEIEFTYAEAEKRGLSRKQFARALDDLIDRGFVDITHHGGGLLKDASTYALSDRWRKWGTSEFEEKTRPKDNRRLGFQDPKVRELARQAREQRKGTGGRNGTWASGRSST